MSSEEKQISLSEEAPANPSRLQENDSEWMTLVATWPLSSSELLRKFNQRGSSLKMSQVSCHLTAEGILESSSGKWQKSGMGSPTEFWTLNSSESRSEDVESSLSDILEEIGEVPPRYYLSEKACRGILRRARRRGKQLPNTLEQALQNKANQEEE